MASKSGVRKLTAAQKEDIQDAFRHLDRDRSGYIFFDDIGDLLRILRQNPTEIEMSEITKRHSAGTNERLDLNAVYRLLEYEGLKTYDETILEMVDAFSKIDKSGDGFISKVELRNFLTKHDQDIVKEDQFDAIMMAADANEDGKIDYNEFVKFLSS